VKIWETISKEEKQVLPDVNDEWQLS